MTVHTQTEVTKKVLIHGGDQTLLATREAILAKQGLEVEIALGAVDLPATLLERRPSLLVICSSLSTEDQVRDLQIARSVEFSPKCLLIRSGSSLKVSPSEVHSTLEWFDGPEKFVSCVKQLI